MAVKVTKLKISKQNNTENTLYATWEFKNNNDKVVSSSIKKGSVVSIKSGATYYNGSSIPSWVMEKKWIVYSVNGDKAIINKSQDGQYEIMSPINVKYLSTDSKTTVVNSTNTLDHYNVKWYYDTGNGVWFSGSSSSETRTVSSTYDYPSNARKVKVSVKPVAKKYKKNGKETYYWSGESVTAIYKIEADYEPETPSAPSIDITKYTLTATLENIEDSKADYIEFYVVKNSSETDGGAWVGDKKFASGFSEVAKNRALWQCDVKAGGEYRVRCRAQHNVSKNESWNSDWSIYSSSAFSIPSKIKKDSIKCTAQSETSVKITWKGVSTATGYTVEYTADKSYFDSSSEVQTLSVEGCTAIVTGLETGKKWYFRVKATNSAGDSPWSGIVSAIVGSTPESPTTWSSTSTAKVGEEIKLYWVHNSEDGSRQMDAEIKIEIQNGSTTVITNPVSETTDDEVDKIYSYVLKTSTYTDGANISWSVRTKGITGVFGPWSITRSIKIYAPPTLVTTVNNGSSTITELPFTILLEAGPDSQTVLGYSVSIVSEDTYDIDDPIGRSVRIHKGDEVYFKNFDVSTNPFDVSLTANSLSLKNGKSYKVKTTVTMNSGLSTSNSDILSVSWSDDMYDPTAAIRLDPDTLTADIAPYCIDSDGNLYSNVSLGVYRREYDGSFTEIKTEISNQRITITDLHPSLDYARYRIVARNDSTGVVGYSDIVEPFGITSIIIQWDEKWAPYEYDEMDVPEEPPWTGSMVKLPYNVDVEESHDPDVSLIEYIGRKHPVSYFGTQRGNSATWSSEIDKTDKETIFALRRLSAWMGNVYIREPSGVGYWAKVSISMPIKHLSLTVPVTLDITRVEGEET